jgi:NAD(P)-dependent dehydrogenase (short-subunit alcohol dehydrogenase family)
MTPSTASRFTDKVALLTGGAAGIGLAVAQALLDEGAKVFIVDYSAPNIESASQTLQSAGYNKSAYLLHYADAADDASVIAFVDKCVEVFGALDVAVLNAGIGGIQKPIWEFSAEEYDLIMRINARGRVFYPCPRPLPSYYQIPPTLARG